MVSVDKEEKRNQDDEDEPWCGWLISLKTPQLFPSLYLCSLPYNWATAFWHWTHPWNLLWSTGYQQLWYMGRLDKVFIHFCWGLTFYPYHEKTLTRALWSQKKDERHRVNPRGIVESNWEQTRAAKPQRPVKYVFIRTEWVSGWCFIALL